VVKLVGGVEKSLVLFSDQIGVEERYTVVVSHIIKGAGGGTQVQCKHKKAE
jgi:hypothetical protein